jgi:hypothetical protein
MNNKQIAAIILQHAEEAPDTLIETDYITIHCDAFQVRAPNTRAALRAMAKKFQKPKPMHTQSYRQAALASKGPTCRREPITALIKRYPEETEAFTMLKENNHV